MSEASACEHTPRDWTTIDPLLLEKTAALFAAIADSKRLRILLLLQAGEACVSEIADFEGENIKTVSARLKKLYNADLVAKRRDAKHIYYSLADNHVIAILDNAVVHIEHQ